MPNDAKLRMVVGVGLVIAVAVIFFRKELPSSVKSGDPSAIIVKSATLPPPANGQPSAPARFITRGGQDGEGK